MQFSELNLSEEIIKAIEEIGYTSPSEIQEKAIPVLIEGKDVIGRSNTGTGKTAAFGIPAIESIPREGTRNVEVLILCPTRELAMQACEELKKFSRFMPWVKPAAVYGGASIDKQIMDLKKGANIVVGTPGRVMDHIERRTLKLGNLKEIILDEADEMLNMGFREDIETILQSVPDDRQTVLFSATMPPAIMSITKEFQNDPEIIKVENKAKTVDSIAQYYFEVPMGRKVDALQLLLLAYEPKLSMIFCNTKRMVDELTEALISKGFRAAGLHGDMKQAQRTQVMNSFKSGRNTILIATDVAARGIDVDDVDVVFNYDLPQDTEYYIHRIGRTGRAGKEGTAFTLISGRKQFYELKDIMKFTKAEVIQKALPGVEDIRLKRLEKVSSRVKDFIADNKNEDGFAMLEQLEAQGLDSRQIAAALLSRRIKNAVKNIPIMTAAAPLKKTGGKTVKVEISVGRQQRIAPNFILGALVDATGMSGKSFGKIDIYDSHTTVEVPEEENAYVIEKMNNGKINGNKVTVKLCESDYRGTGFSKNSRGRKNFSGGGRDYSKKKPGGYSSRKK